MKDKVTQANIRAEVCEDVRNVAKFYLMKSGDMDSFLRYEVNGQQLNGRYWLIGHLVWTEH